MGVRVLCSAGRMGVSSMRWRRVWLAPAVILSAGIVSACSSSTLTAGQSLAKAGQTAATQMDQNITLSANTITTLQAAVAFNDGFNNQIGNSSSATLLAKIAAIQGYLGQYDKILGSLTASYGALGDLASYDASGTFNSSITSLASDTTKFAGALGKPITIPSDVTAGVSSAGGFLIASFQAGGVKDASAKLEVVLKQIIAILDDPGTRSKLIPVQAEVVGYIDQAAVTLLSTQVFSFEPILDELGAPMGMKSTTSSDTAVNKNKQVQAGLRNAAVGTMAAQMSSVAASYDKNLAALKALVPLHDSLQNGAPLNLDSVSSIVGQLQSIATSLQPPKGK
jgi:hypothetical protein